MCESLDMWHAKLGHVNVDSMRMLKHANLIPNLLNREFSKSEVCVKLKFHKKQFELN